MKWNFFKTNWFTITLVLLLLVAIGRKTLHFNTGGSASPDKKEINPEKYTSAGGSSLMGIVPESAGHKALPTINKAEAITFVRRFEKTAISERKKFGVPASVLLACAYLNSYAGQRAILPESNNYFALPCTSDWEGETVTIEGRCYRKYETAWASFRDFSIYLTSREWFGSVKKSAGKDWQIWAKELADRDISDIPNFEKVMEQVIQTHRLYDLDEL